MFALRSIQLYQFKNYGSRSIDMPARVIGICGNNGMGKTNLLDAIHYLCFTRSYFSRTDAVNVQEGASGFRIEGQFMLQDQPQKIVCILRETGKKEFLVNDRPYDKFSHHIGKFPCVIIAPDDAVLITGGSEERRKFLDALLSQLDPSYLQQLIVYTKVLQQRNSLLKSLNDPANQNSQSENQTLLDVLDAQLMKPGEYIFNRRKEFLVGFLPAVKHLYQEIAQKQEAVSLLYESALHHSPFQELLHGSRSKDMYAQRTTVGIHRDDLEISFGAQSFRNTASQGQRKSLLFALKLAEMDVLRKEKKFSPLLLLDDVFEKLDNDRIRNLLAKVCLENEGQVFITDTNEERVRQQLSAFDVDFTIINL